MRESRNGLRPVLVRHYHTIEKGYFHCFLPGIEENRIEAYALIEAEDGRVHIVDAIKVTFDDVESEDEDL